MQNSTRMVLCTLRPFVMGCVLYYHKYFLNHLCQTWCVCFDVWCMCSYQLMNWVNAVKEFIFWRNFWKWSQNNNNLEALKRRKGQLRHILLSVTQKLPSFSLQMMVWCDEMKISFYAFNSWASRNNISRAHSQRVNYARVHTKHLTFLLDWMESNGMSRPFLFAYLFSKMPSLKLHWTNKTTCLYIYEQIQQFELPNMS